MAGCSPPPGACPWQGQGRVCPSQRLVESLKPQSCSLPQCEGTEGPLWVQIPVSQLQGWLLQAGVPLCPSWRGQGAGQHPGVRVSGVTPPQGWAPWEPPARHLVLLICSSGWTWKSWRRSRRTLVSAMVVSAGWLVSEPPENGLTA